MGCEILSNFGIAAGTINTALNLGITLGALGLAFNFANRAIDIAQPTRRKKQENYFEFDYMDYKPKKSKRKNQDIFAFDF